MIFNSVASVFKELCPENFIYFKNKLVIKKLDARKYEESLKEELRTWVTDGNIKKVVFLDFVFWGKYSIFYIVFSCVI